MDYKNFLLLSVFLAISGSPNYMLTNGQASQANRRNTNRDRNKLSEIGRSVLKDAFYEDNSFIVRIRSQMNSTVRICNGILMEEQLVLTDVTCIKYYNGMLNIDANYIQVLAGDPANETSYKVDQVYLNKADPEDRDSELALLRLVKPLRVESQCRNLIRPEKNQSIEFETSVRVIGYTNAPFELKENRSKVSKRVGASKFICTSPENVEETPGRFLLKGAPLLIMVDCRQYQLIGILTKSELTLDSPKREQDCYVMVSTQIKWYERVKSLTALAAKNAGGSTQPSVVVVPVDED